MRIPYKLKLLKWTLFRRSESEKIIKERYKNLFGKDIDLENPRTFTEKLYHRMIMMNRHSQPEFTPLVDKCLVRDYVRRKIGDSYIVKILWEGSRPQDIPFETLPQNYVVKPNNRCGGVTLVNGPVNRELLIKKVRKLLVDNFFWVQREFQYYKIKPRVLVEEYLKQDGTDWPLDYRIWCFNGEPEMIQVDNHSHDINSFYDINWTKLPIHYRANSTYPDIPRPENLWEMINVARTLSRDFDFIRVDLYNLDGRIYFSELTFTPAAGHIKFQPESWDAFLGEKWIMPEKAKAIILKPHIRPVWQPSPQKKFISSFRSMFW